MKREKVTKQSKLKAKLNSHIAMESEEVCVQRPYIAWQMNAL